jgi:hypothetical protein
MAKPYHRAMTPRPLLRLEGAAILAVSIFAYHWSHGSWQMFALLLLLPDLSIAGYAIGARAGSIAYNAVHTYTGPVLLLGYSLETGLAMARFIALIWIAHIAFDRLLGFGLKYPTQFKDTHLNPDRHRFEATASLRA